LMLWIGYLVQRRYCGPSRLEEAKEQEAGQEAARGMIIKPQPLSTTILCEGENDVTYCEEYDEEADEAASVVEPEEHDDPEELEEDYATHTRREYDTKQTLEEKMRTFRPRFRRRNLKPNNTSVAMADREDFE